MAGEEAMDTFNEDFETAFLDAVDDKPQETAETPAEPKTEEKADEKTDDKATDGDAAASEATDGDAEASSQGDQTPPEKTVEAPSPTPESLAIEALQSEIAALKQERDKPKPEEKKPEDTKTNADKDWYAGEFSEDWPDIKRAIDTVAAQIKEEMAQQLQAITTNLQPYVQQTATNAFVTEIRSIHPDFDTVKDAFVGWVKQQPPAIAAAYTGVIKTGTAQDVASLITAYKGTIQQTETKTKEPDAKSAADKATKLSKMEDLGSRETKTKTDVDATDFGGAFEEAVKMVDK